MHVSPSTPPPLYNNNTGPPSGPPASTSTPGGSTSDDRLLLLLRIRALLEECNRQEGDTRLMDIEGLLTSYMRMEEHGAPHGGGVPPPGGHMTPTMGDGTAAHGNMGMDGTAMDGGARKRRVGEAFGGDGGDGMPGGDDATHERVINPDWESMPGVCSPHAEKVQEGVLFWGGTRVDVIIIITHVHTP